MEKKETRRTPAEGGMPGPVLDRTTGLLRDWDFFTMAKEKQPGDGWCMLDLDIGHFKLFLAWNGIRKGDELLRRFGGILQREALETGGLAGYRGQDVFALLMPYDRRRIEALYAELKETIDELTNAVGFMPAIGICMVHEGMDLLECFNYAAITAEEAKRSARERIQLFSPEKRNRSMQELSLVDDFQRAMEAKEITFYLQPQCRASTRQIVGAEALTRWRRADGSFISPGEFVPVLEQYGVVTNLDLYIWESVCAWMRHVMNRGLEPVPVSINISRVDLSMIDVPAKLTEMLDRYSLPARLLKAEITESAYAEDTESIRRAVKQFRAAGILVLMDDFGSGFSSLNMLRSMNMDVIKLDAEFLRMQDIDERKGISILESVINMTKNLSMPIIAEGVESEGQARFLADQGCRYMQGFHFYRPMPAEQFERLLENEKGIDRRGLRFKFNQQLHVREFLDQNKFSDTMLNNILGPVAFYRQKDDNVDIIRYNQQFYLMVGIESEALTERQRHIQQFFYPDDVPRFFQLLDRAGQDHVNGANGEFRIYKPNGVLIWLSVQVYYLEETEQGRLFYASLRDITDKQYLNLGLPGAYYRCTDSDDFELLHISDNFLKLTGFTREDLYTRFDNRLARMVHPDDLENLHFETRQIREGKLEQESPFRLRRKSGGYAYVAEQTFLTDQFGRPCWQSVAVDVTDTVLTRERMALLNRVSHFSVVFVRRSREGHVYEAVIHGQEGRRHMSAAELEKQFNAHQVFAAEGGKDLDSLLKEHHAGTDLLNGSYIIRKADGQKVPVSISFDRIRDHSGVECVLSIRG